MVNLPIWNGANGHHPEASHVPPGPERRPGDLAFDCRHFVGDRPCKPHKQTGRVCTCDRYDPIKERVLIIKLDAMGDVLRTTKSLIFARGVMTQRPVGEVELVCQLGSTGSIATFYFSSAAKLPSLGTAPSRPWV